jgi:hypothetical protein
VRIGQYLRLQESDGVRFGFLQIVRNVLSATTSDAGSNGAGLFVFLGPRRVHRCGQSGDTTQIAMTAFFTGDLTKAFCIYADAYPAPAR